jgi:hypothetical protein
MAGLMALLGFVTEWAYAKYVWALNARRAGGAAAWCGTLVALSWAAVALIVQVAWWLALPGLAGHVTGTYWVVRRDVARQTGPVGPPS